MAVWRTHQMTSPQGKLRAKKKAELDHAKYCIPIVSGTPGNSGEGPTSIDRPKHTTAATGMTYVAPIPTAKGGAAMYAMEFTRVTHRRRLPISPGDCMYGAAPKKGCRVTSKPAMCIHATASKQTFIPAGNVILAKMESGGAFFPVMASGPLARRPTHTSWSIASSSSTVEHTKNGSAQQPASYMWPPNVGPRAHASSRTAIIAETTKAAVLGPKSVYTAASTITSLVPLA